MSISTDVYILIEGKKFTIDQFIAFRQQIGSIRGSDSLTKEIRKDLNNAYKYFSDVTDALIANAVGASQITALSGKGFQADNIIIEDDGSFDISENKTIKTELVGNSIVGNKIGLGGIDLSSITNIATKGVAQTLKTQEYVQATEEFALPVGSASRNIFIDILVKQTSEGRKKYLDSLSSRDDKYGRAANQLITNIETKSSKIYVSTPDSSGNSVIRQIGWTWKDILNNPAASLVISKDGKFNVIFNEKLVSDALNNSTKTTAYKKLTDDFAKKVNDIIAKSKFTSGIFKDFEKFELILNKTIKYTKGSVKVYEATIKEKSIKRSVSKTSTQKTISDAQFTALVQKDVEKKMPKGPLRGPPLSPTILTYRTGTFVDSIRVIQDLRQKLMTYYYAPNYKIHERKGARAPRFLLQSSIRATVQQVYSEKFRILRGF